MDWDHASQILTAANGWCAPSPEKTLKGLAPIMPSWWIGLPAKEPPKLACGCSMNVLETGWHEPGCQVVGEYLCQPVTKPKRAERPLAAVAFEA